MGRKKREAEADPYYFYGHGGYAGYGGLIPTTSGGLVPSGGPLVPGYAAYAAWPYGYARYGYAGCRNNAGALVPCALVNRISSKNRNYKFKALTNLKIMG